MNGVIGMASLLGETPLTVEQRDFVDAIRSSGEALLSIINDILDFSKIEAAKIELEQTDLHIHSILEESVSVIAHKAIEKGLEIIRGLRGHTTGYAVPHFVIDAPGGGGKIPLVPDYVVGRDGDDLVLRNFENGLYRYHDPVARGGKDLPCEGEVS